MKKFKIFIYHLIIFILSSIGIAIYVFFRLFSAKGVAGLGGVIVMPVMILVYVVAFGILCAISFLVWLLIAHLSSRRRIK